MAGKKKTTGDDGKNLPVYVVVGKDRRRAADQIQRLTDQILADADPQVSLSSYEGPSAEIADVLDELRTLPFLSPCRLVVVKEADAFITKYRSILEDYMETPSETGVLLMMADSFPKNTKLAKKVAKVGQIVACEQIKPHQLPDFLIEYARDEYELSMSKTTARLLTELGGDEAGMLMSEVDKLATFIADPEKPSKAITSEHVLALVGKNRQFNIFNVIDAMTGGNTAKALSQLDMMFSQDRDAMYTTVGAFAWHFRRLYNARILMDKRVNPREIIKQLRIWSQTDQFIQQTKQLDIRSIANILRDLMNIDLQSKTGGMDVKTGLEQLILRFGSRARNAAG